jgi:hypothetical protein
LKERGERTFILALAFGDASEGGVRACSGDLARRLVPRIPLPDGIAAVCALSAEARTSRRELSNEAEALMVSVTLMCRRLNGSVCLVQRNGM